MPKNVNEWNTYLSQLCSTISFFRCRNDEMQKFVNGIWHGNSRFSSKIKNLKSISLKINAQKAKNEKEMPHKKLVDMFRGLHETNVRKQIPMHSRWIIEMSIRCLCDSNCANPYRSMQLVIRRKLKSHQTILLKKTHFFPIISHVTMTFFNFLHYFSKNKKFLPNVPSLYEYIEAQFLFISNI